MRAWKTLSMIAAGLVASVAVFAQDPVAIDPTHYKVLVDNASVRVLSVNYAVGATSKMHDHPDTIVIPLVASKVRFNTPDGKFTDADMPNESGKYSPAGKHSPTNIGTAAIRGILVEFKGAAPGKAVLPTSRPGLTFTVLAEGPRAMAYKTTAAPDFAEAAGTKHDFDQVVIALGAAQMSLAIAGKPARTTWARGDVEFIGRGVAHEAKNTGGKPVDMVIVSIR